MKPARPRLILMLKRPVAGRVKTRLGRDIGMTAAAGWFAHQAAAQMRRLRDPRWRLELWIAPDGATGDRFFPRDLPRYAQGGGDLGARMARALRAAPGPSVLIGADIPGVTRRHVADAFAALKRADAVFGPAVDGGFWLVGLARPARAPLGLFRRCRWSTPHALTDAEASLAPLRLAHVATLSDVDRAADLADANFC